VGVILLLFVMFPEKILIVLVLMGIAATLIVSRYTFRGQAVYTKHWTDVSIIIGAATAFALSGWMTLNISSYKSQNQLLLVPGTKVHSPVFQSTGLDQRSKEF